ncbi:SMI1/KNR4 family protein [Aquimarina algicola]|uniref:SMI1/KNR4 family protein n=1 Tax=Aquimarina algicola TaxID=2589995 RepID=A0A504J7G0_9FLAO|nr:SMI1/KNR4 family protein [Aquimarina algicola]TPN86796.1 SMI1/KNR4 family protein [Aquimarina algicola]
MWFDKYDIQSKNEGLDQDIPFDFFTKPCTEEEFEFYKKYNDDSKTHKDFKIPDDLKLPNEYIELLRYSNGGAIINKDREFGFFDINTIREFYINYGFLVNAPNILPIAFNGGGTFYGYKFSGNDKKPIICGVHASCIGFEEDTCFLGNTLDEVLNKTYDIDDDIYEYQVKNGTIKIPTLSKEEKEKTELLQQLDTLKKDKSLGKIHLKEFLKRKRELEERLNRLE